MRQSTKRIIELNETQIEEIDSRLDAYDQNFIGYRLQGGVNIGVEVGGKLVADLKFVSASRKGSLNNKKSSNRRLFVKIVDFNTMMCYIYIVQIPLDKISEKKLLCRVSN